MFDLVQHLIRQKRWSEETFGPGERRAGLADHIRKELDEIALANTRVAALYEWIDIIILALDGAWREGFHAYDIIQALDNKQTKNEMRQWPDWRTAEPGKAIEHIRGIHD